MTVIQEEQTDRQNSRQWSSRSDVCGTWTITSQSAPLWGTGAQVLLMWWWRSAALYIWIIGALSVRPGANGIQFERCCSLQRRQLSFISSFRLTVMIEWILRDLATMLWSTLSVLETYDRGFKIQAGLLKAQLVDQRADLNPQTWQFLCFYVAHNWLWNVCSVPTHSK